VGVEGIEARKGKKKRELNVGGFLLTS